MATPAPVPLQGKPDGGHVKFILHGARNLKNVQCCGRMDPYVRMTLGPNEEESATVSGGHIQPTWTANPTYFFEVGRVAGANYDKLKVEVRNHNCFCDDDIGIVEIPLEKIVPDAYRPEEPLWIWVGEVNNANAKAGELHATVKYVPPMTITVHEARNLNDVQLIGKQDPYVVLEMVGCLAKGDNGQRKTRTHDDGDRNPRWGESFKFNILDENSLRSVLDGTQNKKLLSATEMKHNDPGLWLQVIDENVVVDKSIGYVHIPLLRLLELRRSGKPEFFGLFKGQASEGGHTPGGEICISVK